MLKSARRHRRGLAIIEISAASLVLMVCLALMAQLLFLIARQERAADARQAATIAVANQLETLLARDFAELPIGDSEKVTAPAEVLALLPTAAMKMHISAGENDRSKQLRVELTWRDASGELVHPISLTAWKHGPGKETQP